MCIMVYIASDGALPEIPWDPEAPSVHVTALGHDHPARSRFSLPHVHYAGSHEQCGCGFQLGQYPGVEDDEAPARSASLQALADYLDVQLAKGRRLQLYACWSGDEGASPDGSRSIPTSTLRDDAFYFHERELLHVEQPT
jgi:hypothetical protein